MTDESWSDKTTVYRIPTASGPKARVYRIKTGSSAYLLGVFDRGTPRPFAILRGLSQTVGHEIDLRDSSPLIGDANLYELPLEQWKGKRIDMAGTKTSAIESVYEETNQVQSEVISRTLMMPVPAAPPPKSERPPVPYHVECVEYVEALASILRRLANDRATIEKISADHNLVSRLKVALTTARMASDDLARTIP